MYRNPDRHYRRQDCTRPDEHKFQVIIEETDLWITVPRVFALEAARDCALQAALIARREIEFWCKADPAFRHSLSPVETPEHAPPLVRHMAEAARLMEVGPFAAVAGAVAQRVADVLAAELTAKNLPPEVIVENGGDTYLHSCRERTVALLPDPAAGSIIGLKFQPRDFPLSLCSSSATIGPSLSFGQGDIAMVRAKDGALADAAATTYGNMLKGASGVAEALAQAEKDAKLGIEGLFVQCAGRIGLWGKLELTAIV